MIFESQILALLATPHYTNSQNSMFLFDYTWCLAKTLSNFVSLPWKLHNQFCHTNRIAKLIVETDNNADAISSNIVSIKSNADVIEENADLISNNTASLENLTNIPDITALQVRYLNAI